jgi:hypothetical protein
MEPKSKKIRAKEAAAFVEYSYPPGTTLKHVGTGRRYMMGARAGRDSFWMMSLGKPEKGSVPALTIKIAFERVA